MEKNGYTPKEEDDSRILLPLMMLYPLWGLHELAHIAQPAETAFLGPAYAGIYLELVHKRMGRLQGRSAASAFGRHGVWLRL